MAEFDGGTLYDANKKLVKQNEKPLTLSKVKARIATVFRKVVKKFKDDDYFMLLCNDRKDYTVFHNNTPGQMTTQFSEVLELCFKNRGTVYSIDPTEDGIAVEIWIEIDDEMYCYYFFPYSSAVEEV